jgi:prephenate dehydratase
MQNTNKQMKNITFLGPVGATFSNDAYNLLAEKYGAPEALCSETESNCLPASNNEEILGMISEHKGYGAIAMETLAGGRVSETLESFIELLQKYDVGSCPFHIVGAVKMKLHFCLMVRPGLGLESVSKIIAHPKALGACKERVAKTGIPTEGVSSNGEAARLLAENPEYQNCAALGPKSAAQKYGLKILDEAYEDREAVTTFFLITPKEHVVSTGKNNRVLIVCRLKHESGSLVKALQALASENLNMIQIHSMYTRNNSYDFAIEVEVSDQEISGLEKALEKFETCVEKHLFFGPFEVLST